MSSDDVLAELMNSFMQRLRAYLRSGGPEDIIDRVLAATTIGAAAVMILWSPNRKVPGFIGIILAMTKQVWDRRKWWGLP